MTGQPQNPLLKVLVKCLGSLCVLVWLATPAIAQNIQFTQGNVGPGLENTITVPLRTYPGRGAASLPINLYYSSRVWRISAINTINNNVWFNYQTITEAIYAEQSVAGWKTSLDIPIIEWPRNDDTYYYTGKAFCHVCNSGSRQFRVARMYITMPDGSKHELRKNDQPYEGPVDMFGTFYAVDGSRLRYDSTGQNTGTLFMPDGTRYLLNGSTTQYMDRNGNTLNYDNASRQWTDTLGRVIGLPLPANPSAGEQLYYLPGVPLPYKFIWKHLGDTGMLTPLPGGGVPTRKPIANEYLPFPGQPPTPPSGNNFPVTIQSSYSEMPSLFISAWADDEDLGPPTIVVGRGQITSEAFNPVVLAEIVLPNNLSYKFTYNIYGEIDKIVYPTGGFQNYQFNAIPTIGDVKQPYSQVSRGVTLRQQSANGTGTDLVDWQYSVASGAGYLRVTSTPPLNGARTESYRKNYATPGHQSTQGGLVYYWPFGFEDSRQGEVYEERVFAAGAQGPLLRRTLKEFEQTASTVQPSIPQLDPTTKTAYRNARPVKEVSLMLDTGGDALAKTTTYEYQDNTFQLTTGLDLTASNESYFATVAPATAQTGAIEDIPVGPLASRSETTYLDDAQYRTRNILHLPTSVLLKDSNLQIVSKTESLYDESFYPLLPAYSDLGTPDWNDPGTPARGNVTTIRRYFDIGDNLYLETHAQFDQCGNSINSWNERNILSQIEYSSAFKHAYVTGSSSAVPDPNGVRGSNTPFTTGMSYELTTGLLLSVTDANGQSTNYSYQNDLGVTDPLKRLRKVTRPDGGWTKTEFNDVVGDLFVYTQIKQDDTHISKSYQYVDPLGRPSRSFSSEGGSNYIATDTLYDGLGRVLKTSNPYRTTQRHGLASEAHTNNWTTSRYEALGRVDLVTLPDTSTVLTEYNGIYTTVTDQAGRQRRQKKDSRGRIERVDEPDANSGALGNVDNPLRPTLYSYDALGNVVHIQQGTSTLQHRYFKYDALSRLTHERQVEQAGIFTAADALTGNSSWSRKLIYDETAFGINYKGLLTSVYDARNILSSYSYDNLNRLVNVSYSDGVTPAITNFYDVARFTVPSDSRPIFNRGRMAEVQTAALGSVPLTSQQSNYDLMGRAIQTRQTVDTNIYTLAYTYNLGSALTSETYPSGRVVNFNYDDAARLAHVNSGATNYASQFNYGQQGLLNGVTLGNGVVETLDYNSRLQLKSIDLTKTGSQLQHYDYKYGVYDPVADTLDETRNTGQVAQIEGFISNVKQWKQRFAYDKLSRLQSAREHRGDNNQQSYLVNYDYDIFGNRYQYQAQNGGNPFQQSWVESGQINQTSNRFASGVSYDDAGNITTDTKFRNLQFQYDANNRQRWSAKLDGSGAATAVFDGAGQRVATMSSGGLNKIYVYDAMGKLVAEYGPGEGQGGTQYVSNDHQGSPRVITGSGVDPVISRHDYLPFGEELAATVGMRSTGQHYGATDGVRKKYASMENDEASGMAHTLWRKYDDRSGRWTTTDPYGGSMTIADPQSFNRYTYVNNDPVNQIDPSGLMGMTPDASTSWSQVLEQWTSESAGSVRETGRSIIGARESSQASAIANGMKYAAAAKAANKAWEEGNGLLALMIVLGAGGNVGMAEATEGEVTATAEVTGPVETTPFVVKNVDKLESQAANGTHKGYQDEEGYYQCARLPLAWQIDQEGFLESRLNRGSRLTENWVMGATATYGSSIAKGTVLATFNRATGKYAQTGPGEGGNNHTVIFLNWYYEAAKQPQKAKGADYPKIGMRVIEQFNGPPRIRTILFDNTQTYHSNAGAFNVVRIAK